MGSWEDVSKAEPTAPDIGRRLWARAARIAAERRKYADRHPVSGDDILNLRIDLALSQDVWDVSGVPERT